MQRRNHSFWMSPLGIVLRNNSHHFSGAITNEAQPMSTVLCGRSRFCIYSMRHWLYGIQGQTRFNNFTIELINPIGLTKPAGPFMVIGPKIE